MQAGENIPDLKKGSEMSQLPILKDAFLVMKNNTFKPMEKWMNMMLKRRNSVKIDATGKFVFPGFAIHIRIPSLPKLESGVDRINGLSYEEIALKGGGI